MIKIGNIIKLYDNNEGTGYQLFKVIDITEKYIILETYTTEYATSYYASRGYDEEQRAFLAYEIKNSNLLEIVR